MLEDVAAVVVAVVVPVPVPVLEVVETVPEVVVDVIVVLVAPLDVEDEHVSPPMTALQNASAAGLTTSKSHERALVSDSP